MRFIFKLIYKTLEIIRKAINKLFLVPGLKASLGKCGDNVRIAYDCDIKYPYNIYIGNNSQIGPHSLFWTTRAKILIGNHVLMGPNVNIITGDHRVDIIGKHIEEVTDTEKLDDNDEDVKICDGVWIGSNVTILKGVTIEEGCIIAAGSVVTKSTDAYSIYAGVPAKKVKNRFSEPDLKKHLEILGDRNKYENINNNSSI